MAFGKFGKYYPGGAEVRMEDFDLIAALREHFDAVRAGPGAAHAMTFESNVERCDVRSDRMHLCYVVMNLLLNAVKYSPAGGEIQLKIERSAASAKFSVSDQGMGVPEADVAQLFSPFFRASNVGERPGSGMGLAIVKKSAQLIGARVDIETRANQGSTFTVTLAAAQARPEIAASQARVY